MRNKTLLYDLDGVLLDACDWHKDALNKALQEVSNFSIAEEDHTSLYNGIPTKKKLQKLELEGKVDKKDFEKIIEFKNIYLLELVRQNASSDFDQTLLLYTLKEKGCKIGCCTNSIRLGTMTMLESLKITKYFDIILTNEDITSPKPNPEIYITAMDRLGSDPKDTWIFEDSEVGIIAAKLSGANVIEVKNAKDAKEKIREFIKCYLS